MVKNRDLFPEKLTRLWARRLVWARNTAYRARVPTDSVGALRLLGYWRRSGVQHFSCFFCSASSQQLGVIRPYDEGGSHTRSNYFPLCDHCDEVWRKLAITSREVILQERRLTAGLHPPEPAPRPKRVYKQVPHPQTEAEWDAWLANRKRRAQSG